MTAPSDHSAAHSAMTLTRRARAVLLLVLVGWIGTMNERARIRRDLRKLAMAEDHILRDLGITRIEVMRLQGRMRD
ncbi:MAG: hypothetical protein DI533_08805 [Cereibacter sphaeroides]|uniref:DUF1127 domain-containing protein n=1 Tax=Cereibacter sphaeroides TaxID=1063 RepID=A0A2W5TWW3_CERSP|nr:MAG: hypothetical protein DI533_08805 [Cereibacter sphaeroides]